MWKIAWSLKEDVKKSGNLKDQRNMDRIERREDRQVESDKIESCGITFTSDNDNIYKESNSS